MLNNVVLVGRITDISELLETESGICYAKIILSVKRAFRNSYGEYDCDLIRCSLWRGLAEELLAICKVESILGIKGRLQTHPQDYEIVVEKFINFTESEKEKE